ncbi:hypothetical protein GALMADRAFT_142657 [Galerina marginata CBS 339.88]|uniref:Hydrophobin n=1 Tax=Galerina marginata (strain CBS 339.88) TaxID=685588 RepID=A0A067SZ75_GALM3|nr:hypothetical protein GALMADRAFT_142657 [Galerina marginata CBS 339.88]
MFSRISIALALATMTTLVAATYTTTVTPSPAPTSEPANQCNSGNLQCCNLVQSSSSSVVGQLIDSLGILIDGGEALVGIACTPIDILGLSQGSCHSQPVCCQNNDFHGVVAIGCVPIRVNL